MTSPFARAVERRTGWRALFVTQRTSTLILSFRVTPTQTNSTQQQHDDDDRNDRNDNVEGLPALHDNTDNAVEVRSVKSLQRVVWSPTPWKSATDVLMGTEKRDMATKPTAFVLRHKRESVTSLFCVVSSPLIVSGTSAMRQLPSILLTSPHRQI